MFSDQVYIFIGEWVRTGNPLICIWYLQLNVLMIHANLLSLAHFH